MCRYINTFKSLTTKSDFNASENKIANGEEIITRDVTHQLRLLLGFENIIIFTGAPKKSSLKLNGIYFKKQNH